MAVEEFFYTTKFEEFREQNKTNLPKFVKDFLSNPEVSQIHRYEDKIFLKRFNTEAYARLLIFKEEDGIGNTLYVPRRYFKDHKEYEEFFKLGIEGMKRKCRCDEKEKEEIRGKFREFIPKSEKPPLPQDKWDFEKQRDFSNKDTSYVFEMEEWVEHIKKDGLTHDKKEIYKLLQEIIVYKKYGEPDKNGWHYVPFGKNKQIVFRISIEDIKHTYFYLFDIGENIDIDKLNSNYLKANEGYSNSILRKKARKGYPDWIMYEEFEDWIKLENDDEANLALSDEEVEVLNNIPYPYFINGLAGSGKSTILYYLFALAYAQKIVKEKNKQPEQTMKFLSYSDKLVEKAQNVVWALLQTNPGYSFDKKEELDRTKLNECFSSFIKFLRDAFLTTTEEENYFDPKKHVNYERFQKEYQTCRLQEKDKYSAAIVWSVIRTFIKGRDYKNHFFINDYKKLNRDDRTVIPDDYENIYRIFKNWYSPFLKESDSWDDLDLIRYILNKMDREPDYKKYDIIYCDEAQDFTPIENELIIRLSTYTNYNLKDFRKIPIAYAGDPNQTVSPTGFRWARLKDIVQGTFEEQLGGDKINLKDETLNNNYRSKRTIVELANSIQYIRKCFLTNDSLCPQNQWNPQENAMPGFIFADTDEDEKFVKQCLDLADFIITGDEGEYINDINEDKFTEESTQIKDELLLQIENKGKLCTAISSKGLEQKSVILYHFADKLPLEFRKLIDNEQISDESERYELSHFFTKLYIAVSRARELLYIVDTKENYDRFWKYFKDNGFVKQLMYGRQDATDWEEKVGGIELAVNKEEVLERLKGFFDPLSVADYIFENAKLSKNANDMRRAVGYYEEAHNHEKANIAKAYVYLYEGAFKEAGDRFERLGMKDDTINAYWEGECWEKLKQCPNVQYSRASQYMLNEISLVDFIVDNDDTISKIEYKDDIWKKVVLQMQKSAGNIPQEYIFSVCEKLELLVERGFLFLNETIADLYFRNESWNKAISKWDRIKKTEHKDYFQAKEEVSSTTSEKIKWMYRGQKNKEILENYGGNDDASNLNFDDETKSIIFGLWLTPRTFLKALNYPYDRNDRLGRLYSTDRIQFLQHCILKDFTEEKYTEWIERRVELNDTLMFETAWSEELLKQLFNTQYFGYNDKNGFAWHKFISLRDNNQYRLLKNEINSNTIADFLPKILDCEELTKDEFKLTDKISEKKIRATCFLDYVFDLNYNYMRAKKYEKDIVKVFKDNDFQTQDFYLKSLRNKYFQLCNLQDREVNTIKDNLKDFVEEYFKNLNKIRKTDIEDYYKMCIIFEKVVTKTILKEEFDSDEKINTREENIDKFYANLKKQKNIAENKDFVQFINLRLAWNGIRKRDIKTLTDWENKNFEVNYFLKYFDKEDFTIFMELAFGKSIKDNVDILTTWMVPLAEKCYRYDFKLRDIQDKRLRDKTFRDVVSENVVKITDKAIQDLLQADIIDEYYLKLLAFMYEIFLSQDIEIAEKYDELIKLEKIKNSEYLVKYLKDRALMRYNYSDNKLSKNDEQREKELKLRELLNYSDEKLFESKQQEYGIEGSKMYRRPIISKTTTIHTPNKEPQKTNEPIFVVEDTKIGGITVALQKTRKTIYFSKGEQDLVEVRKGKIRVEDGIDVKLLGNTFVLENKVFVKVLSENKAEITFGKNTYKIDL